MFFDITRNRQCTALGMPPAASPHLNLLLEAHQLTQQLLPLLRLCL
jgi:hypothetical protein